MSDALELMRRIVDQETDPAAAANAIADHGRTRRMTIERVDGNPVAGTSLGAALASAGFRTGYKGLSLTGR